MTDTAPQPRRFWLFFMVACLALAAVAVAVLIGLIVTDGDLFGGDDDDDDTIVRPTVEFVDLEDGDLLPFADQTITVRVAHPDGVESARFFVRGRQQVFDADAGDAEETDVTFPFRPDATGEYTLVTEATAVDGTVSDQVEVTVTVSDGE
jgi:hypothetical protein